ncbi:MAG: hypothetical protein JWR21_852 [Herminiimonas sp.]|nr:hypothetical protein [Herminiimonas sp.]
MPNPIDISNQRFGKLLAIKPVPGPLRRWLCICDCGKETVLTTNKLTSGHTQSCGCIKALTTITNGFKNKVHGHSHLRDNATYRSWTSMRSRCNGKFKGKEAYWERGISICARWESFSNFLADMGERPDDMTLDRIDVDGDYEPGNCRWASLKQQQRNQRTTNYLVIDGVKTPAMDIADDLGVPKSAMSYFLSVSKKLRIKYGCVPDIEGGLPMDS